MLNIALGIVVAVLSWYWQYDTPPVEMLEPLAVAAHLRPPEAPFGNLWPALVAPLYAHAPLTVVLAVLRWTGHVCLGLIAAGAFSLFRMLLPSAFRRGEKIAWWHRVEMGVLATVALLFVFSWPIWHAFNYFTPLALQASLAVFALAMAFVYCFSRLAAPLYASVAASALLMVDAPAGVFVLVAVLAIAIARFYVVQTLRPLTLLGQYDVTSFVKWRATLALLVAFVAGLAVEVWFFVSSGGLEAFGWAPGELGIEMLTEYVKHGGEQLSPGGVALFLAVGIVPALVVFRLIPRAMKLNSVLSYAHGWVFAIVGTVAFLQLSGASVFWFWTWGGAEGCLADDVLKVVAVCASALALVWTFAVFVFALYFRNLRRIGLGAIEDDGVREAMIDDWELEIKLRRRVRVILLAVPLTFLALTIPFRKGVLERDMLECVAEAIDETAHECEDVEYLFTDGSLDAGVELAAAADGHSLKTLSMMGGAVAPRDVFLRLRDATNEAYRVVLESGAPDALRTWGRASKDAAPAYAVQLGFELWQRDNRPVPECSGLVASPDGFAEDERERGIKAAHELAEHILEVYEEGDPDRIPDRALRNAFLFEQWRLAVLARHRADASDAAGKRDEALLETSIANDLDGKNDALNRIRADLAWGSRRRLERMTPAEGLRLGLHRADFALASMFARSVLLASPDDPAANFAVGMDYFMRKQYTRAQAHLEVCLKGRPDDPAVLNNLAQCHIRRGDLKGALPYAKRALEIMPDAPEIRRTYERVAGK